MTFHKDLERNDLLITASSDDVRRFIQWIGPEQRPSDAAGAVKEPVGQRTGDIP